MHEKMRGVISFLQLSYVSEDSLINILKCVLREKTFALLGTVFGSAFRGKIKY